MGEGDVARSEGGADSLAPPSARAARIERVEEIKAMREVRRNKCMTLNLAKAGRSVLTFSVRIETDSATFCADGPSFDGEPRLAIVSGCRKAG